MNKKITFFSLVLFIITSHISAQTFYEAENGTLFGVASIQDCGNCSGGKQVGDLGYDRYFTYDVSIAEEGIYRLKFSYSSAQDRSIFISINGDSVPAQALCNNGEWSTKSDREVDVKLVSGVNTIKFFNDYGWAPNIDGFSLELLSYSDTYYEAETDSNLYGVASIQDCGSCSGGKQVGDLGYDRYMTYDVTVAQTGSYNLKLIFNSGDPRSIFISANDANSLELSCLSGDWGLYANQDISINLNEGVNTLKFYNDNDWAPNIDAFSLRLIQEDAGECNDCNQFTYGNDGKMEYNLQTGTFDVFQQDQLIVQASYSEVSNGDTLFSSKEYSQRTINQSSFSDDLGSGIKVTVDLTDSNFPEMQQNFYFYDEQPFFLMEVVIQGQILESNYMAPMVSSHIALEAQGDNRLLDIPFDNDAWVRYNALSLGGQVTNISSEVTAFYENNSRNGIVIGSVEHAVWKTGIESSGVGNVLNDFRIWGGYTSASDTRDENPHGKIKGDSIKSPKIFVGYFEDWRLGMESYGNADKLTGGRYINDWNEAVPFGWNSWGSIQSDITLDKAKSVVDFFADEIPMFRNNETAYIDLDSYWDNLVEGGLEGDFTKLSEFVDYCNQHNLKPGIYWAPFVDWGKFDRRVEGSTYNYADTWIQVDGGYHDVDGARAMDPTHPATRDRIDLVIDKFKQAGFKMIKIDFIGHAAAEANTYYDPDITTGMQAFKSGMQYLTDKIGGEMLVYAAISPNMASGRYVHMRRIACDAYADINATEYTLNSTSYGWWQSQIYDYLDADHIVFGNSSEGENRARLASAIVTGTIITGDDFSSSGNWGNTAKELLQNEALLKLAKNGKAFRPVEGNTGDRANEVFVNQVDGVNYVAVFNYGDQKSYNIALDRLGFTNEGYCVKELFTGDMFALNGNSLQVNLGAKDVVFYEFNSGENSCIFSLPDNYQIQSTDASCNGSKDGEINIDFKNADYTYTIEISGKEPIILPQHTTNYNVNELSAGSYELCFTIDEAQDYKQCFEITISEPGTIDAVSSYNKRTSTVHISLKGAERYYVDLNGDELLFNSGEHDLKLRDGLNELSVRSDLSCQGIYHEKIYVSQESKAYPNPTKDFVQISLSDVDGVVQTTIHDLHGNFILTKKDTTINSKITVDLSSIKGGVYFVNVSGKEYNETFKVLKK
ncbi:T9SS type A sorting domain-containing protein [Galbibacter pacificus]|uniref:T9SS type A sorting domain-containing protein n=1 Tax=Galbibacter pacificus TaxID=2996052 RepID=A0ABT6FMT3_9FLAO|nr:T9SS type A sorting domain-containing protein [Galbibacter pacificus]MDG3581087.1 T9SS type A sorting domain-containing protein [Galbibacter pacificus]MDG3584565.1 T9SS type A sorting domain-containing protein [Galbibacter pacificus]